MRFIGRDFQNTGSNSEQRVLECLFFRNGQNGKCMDEARSRESCESTVLKYPSALCTYIMLGRWMDLISEKCYLALTHCSVDAPLLCTVYCISEA